jgi:N-acyl-D-amino-acid deacylase
LNHSDRHPQRKKSQKKENEANGMLLKNGIIYDGTGNPPYIGSVLVKNDKIVKIYQENEPLKILQSEPVKNCAGLVIAPGFIDAHSHNDFFAAREDSLKYFLPFVQQGVTTMVTGNCGFSAAGYQPNSPFNDQVGGGLFSNLGKDFSDFAQWSKQISGKMPVNLVSLVGHGTVRIGLNGKVSGALSPQKLKELEATLEKALDQGAAGISLGLMYEPGQFAPYEELEMVARLCKKHDKILTVHARAYSKVSTSYHPPVGGRAHNLRAMDEVLKIMKATQVKTEYSHLIFVGKQSWGTVDESLKLLEEAKKAGFDIGFDLYPMEFGASIITVVLPAWYLERPKEKRKGLVTQARLALEVFIAIKALGFGFSDILIANTYGQIPEIEGKRISEIAKERKQGELKTYLDIVDGTHARCNVLMYKYQNPDIIERLRNHPQSLYMTDAWIEDGASVQNFACHYAFAKFITLARDKGTKVEMAIAKMTGETAKRFGIVNRGVVKEGAFADLTVFDLAKLSFREGTQSAPEGIRFVMTNGKIVVENGKPVSEEITTCGRFVPIQ